MILLMLAIFSYAALALDAGCGSWGFPASTVPQFLYLVAAVSVLLCRGAGAIVGAIVVGIFADVIHGGPLGISVVLLANLSFLSQLVGARHWRNSLMISAAFILIYVATAGFASETAREVLKARLPEFGMVSTAAISRAGGTVVVYLIVMTLWGLAARSIRRVIPRRTIVADRPTWAQ